MTSEPNDYKNGLSMKHGNNSNFPTKKHLAVTEQAASTTFD